MTKDFEERFAYLNARNVKALIVGGYAVAFHAKPRFTQDVDLFIEPSPADAERRSRPSATSGLARSVCRWRISPRRGDRPSLLLSATAGFVVPICAAAVEGEAPETELRDPRIQKSHAVMTSSRINQQSSTICRGGHFAQSCAPL